jgi:hypothetical protein
VHSVRCDKSQQEDKRKKDAGPYVHTQSSWPRDPSTLDDVLLAAAARTSAVVRPSLSQGSRTQGLKGSGSRVPGSTVRGFWLRVALEGLFLPGPEACSEIITFVRGEIDLRGCRGASSGDDASRRTRVFHSNPSSFFT